MGGVPKLDPALLRMFAELNQRHFGGELAVPEYLRFDTVGRKTYGGGYGVSVCLPGKTIIGITPEARAKGETFYRDTLLHEMIHQAVNDLDGGGERFNRHGPKFVHRANMVAAELGLGSVEADSEAALTWPQELRPEGYYERGGDSVAGVRRGT